MKQIYVFKMTVNEKPYYVSLFQGKPFEQPPCGESECAGELGLTNIRRDICARA